MLDFIKNLLADERGSVSHKRFIATLGSFCLFGVYIFTKNDHLADLIFSLIALCMGFATWDKINNK